LSPTSTSKKKAKRDAGRERGAGEGATGDRRDAGESRSGKKSLDKPFAVELVHARRSHLSWTLACLLLGSLLLWKLAVIGKILGVVLLVVAAISARRLALTLLNEPGTIRIDSDEVSLPVGLCRGVSRGFSTGDVTHAFFLRRAVPWTRAGPILIVEVGDSVFSYPRDWFASESEQRRILEAINRRLGRM